MADIDIGLPAIARPGGYDQGATLIALDNPANLAGKIKKVELWFQTNATGVKAGTFFGAAPNFTCRDFEVIGNVASGAKRTFTGLNIDVEIGDFIGVYSATGQMEKTDDVHLGIYHKWGDQFEAGEQGYALQAGDGMSVYGEGDVPSEGGGGGAGVVTGAAGILLAGA